ncbi:hypothetical protein CCAX7_65230 [Capsulimonas corticalis]|uniref:Uncharacterized protein n=1 Tax=Capsulimonas corticalis TaxID=2219043 RepID=A0A402CR29_9BACT|nr:AraC family transcriptional regulator [Capsulimonas corticalis]BDI34472.1 hypothetical protein CCAX7_65230 [Capsulimonas corticalis]
MKLMDLTEREVWASGVFESRDRRRTHGPETMIAGGFERRVSGDSYYWDGLRRGGDPSHPFLVLQYTVSGWGIYQEGGVTHRVEPGMAFLATIPSPHVYQHPSDSQNWSFLYLILLHPYVAQRLIERKKTSGPVFTMPDDGALLTRFLTAFETVHTSGYRDRFAEEQAAFELLVEYERAAHHAAYPRAPREKLLDEARAFAMARLPHPADVAELSETFGMSRSRFSHYFRDVTGLAPAGFLRQVRLEEVTRLLVQSDLKLEAIAVTTGFANANDLCKVFRRYFHLSPGEFRRQMRGG